MLLLCMSLALAQDPAPAEGEEETSASQDEVLTGDAAWEPSDSSAPESTDEDTGAQTELPTEIAAPMAQSEVQPGPTEPEVAAEPPAPAEPPPPQGTYEEGYAAGVVAAQEFTDWLQPAVSSAGQGAGIAGVGMACGGLVCGGPVILAGVGYPVYKNWREVPEPPPGHWQTYSADFQTGFIQGYQATARKTRTRSSLAGAGVGMLVGATTASVVVYAAYQNQGLSFFPGQ
ncbi:MAG: hypothetical protein VX899_02165 [Myxococcota bacterium]|nr:hypothetical protein [Myxococcota bacterium]